MRGWCATGVTWEPLSAQEPAKAGFVVLEIDWHGDAKERVPVFACLERRALRNPPGGYRVETEPDRLQPEARRGCSKGIVTSDNVTPSAASELSSRRLA
jgi:hypothetical protein